MIAIAGNFTTSRFVFFPVNVEEKKDTLDLPKCQSDYE